MCILLKLHILQLYLFEKEGFLLNIVITLKNVETRVIYGILRKENVLQ